MNTEKHENSNYVKYPHVHVCFLPLKVASLVTHLALLSYDVIDKVYIYRSL